MAPEQKALCRETKHGHGKIKGVHKPVQEATSLPQRSSLRRAVQKSLELASAMGFLCDITTTTTQVENQATFQKVEKATGQVESPTEVNRVPPPTDISAPDPSPRRSPLRRAIRESSAAVNVLAEANRVSLAQHSQTHATNTAIAAKLLEEYDNPGHAYDGAQRSSLRRAIRESQQEATRHHEKRKTGAKIGPSSSDERREHTSCCAMSQAMATGPKTSSNARNISGNGTTRPKQIPTSNTTFSHSALDSARGPIHAQQQVPSPTGKGKTKKSQHTRLDYESETARKGWYRVRQIIDNVDGMYLVEWEGCDPRTGIMWPASWVKAEDVSEGAIRDWEERNDLNSLENANCG
ncbi:hypothetical protein GGS20DRAFT_591337 [Poronia punctata]|nr:hypothetical protein GGS20DRAFT_591337 [Poronia punctata]